jgi:hypothetical protein
MVTKPVDILSVLGRIFGQALIFNSLLTIAYGTSIYFLLNQFFPNGQPFYPYLLYGHVFWLLIIVGLLNIVPCALLSCSFNTGRFLFHHYVYGFIVIIAAYAYLALIPSNAALFWVYDTRVSVNIGRVFFLVGAAMVIDDLPDVHPKIDSLIRWVKPKAACSARPLSVMHFVAGAICLYIVVVLSVGLWLNPSWATTTVYILIGNLVISCLISFIALSANAWFRLIKAPIAKKNHIVVT